MPQRKQRGKGQRIDVQPGRPGSAQRQCVAPDPVQTQQAMRLGRPQRIVQNPPDTPGATKRPATGQPHVESALLHRPPAEDEGGSSLALPAPSASRGARRSHRPVRQVLNPAAPTCRGVVTAGTGLEQVAPGSAGPLQHTGRREGRNRRGRKPERLPGGRSGFQVRALNADSARLRFTHAS